MSGLWETDFGTFARGSVPPISTLFDSQSETTWRHLLGERNVLGSFDVSATHYHVFGPQQDTTGRIARHCRQTLGSDTLDWFARSRRTPSFPGPPPTMDWRDARHMAAWSHNSASDHLELGGDRCQYISGTKFPEAQGRRCPEGGREEEAQGLAKEGRVGIKCPARAHSPLRGQGVGGLYHKRQTSHMYRLGRDGE